MAETESIESYRDLSIYQQALDLSVDLEKEIRSFPSAEANRVVDQLARSSAAVGAHIAEGWGRKSSTTEFTRYLRMALGEVQETKYWIEFATKLGHWDKSTGRKWWKAYDELAAQTYSAIETWEFQQ